MGSPEHLRYTSTDTRRGCPISSADRKKPSRPEGLAYGQAGEEQDTKIAFLQLPFAAFRNAYSGHCRFGIDKDLLEIKHAAVLEEFVS